jgi:hydroxymethylpyrimidine pyrophosphatase-like HAD family hydrolase/energy-coupling factor transporter ATP-binding protein EcfA2
MLVHVLASDYDGTLACEGRVAPATVAALRRVRESGRKVVLVTGRLLADLRTVFPDLDGLFDAVVAENGALLYFPGRREVRTLGTPPEPALLEALGRHGVEFAVGASIIASAEVFAEPALAAIRETGLERTLIFNKGAMMLLPGGVTKGSGLLAALKDMELSAHNTVGMGDAENDHAFLAVCECAVAVADGVPSLRERADVVTAAPNGEGVVEFVETHVMRDLADLVPRLTRHAIPLGERAGGTPMTLAAHGTHLLIVGPSGSGKSTLTGVLVERLVEAARTVCLLDPEGDYQPLSGLEGVVVLGGKGEHALPEPEELGQLLPHRQTSLVLDLSALSRTEKVDYATQALAMIAAVRARTGAPHWLVVDEAHHIAPFDGSSADSWLRSGSESVCLITLTAGDLSREVRPWVNVIASTDLDAFADSVRTLFGADALPLDDVAKTPLARGEAVLADLRPSSPRAERFRVGRRRIAHRRHVRKYVEGELPPDRSFYFRGPEGKLNLRAANLARFGELAEGVDDATWTHHLRERAYSGWVESMIKDPELAHEIAAVEAMADLGGAESRTRVLDAIRRRYAV